MNLSSIPLYDHHCHALRRLDRPLELREFRRYFTESADPAMLDHVPETLFYKRAIRDLADLLGCDASEEAVLAARNVEPLESYAARAVKAANIDVMVVDTGLRADENYSVEEEQKLLPCRVREVLRLETLAERLLEETHRLEDFEDRFREEIRTARRRGIVALKSIMAYRCGLYWVEPTDRDNRAQVKEYIFGSLRQTVLGDPPYRIHFAPLINHIIGMACEEAVNGELPLQFHTGFGDTDIDLEHGASPLSLRSLLEYQPFKKIPIVLLHCYPFVREAGYLANVYPNAFVDLSLTIPFTAHGGTQAILDALELAPISKVMLATDAFSIPEIFYVAALGCRKSLGTALERLGSDGWLRREEASDAAKRLLHDNAEALYGSPS